MTSSLTGHGAGVDSGGAGFQLGKNPLDQTTNFVTWALMLPRLVLRARTKTSWYLASLFSAQRLQLRHCLPATTFPLPLLSLDALHCSGPGLSRKRLLKVARRRLHQLVVMTLNVEALGRFPSGDEIRRQPNPWQRRCLDFLWQLIVACGSGLDEFPVPPGRSGPELGALLFQLEKFVVDHPGLGDGYTGHDPVRLRDDPELITAEEHPELFPYKSLDAGRLKLVGEGKWPLMDFLNGPFWLPYMEPRFLWHDSPIDDVEVPNFMAEDREENLKLLRIWDAKGLLQLYRSPLKPGCFSRVFNAFKSKEVDRQIGDRRLPNALERAIPGPSSQLPQGYLLTNLRVARFTEQVRASITDRTDFYHQAQVSESRARSNMLPFAYDEEELIGLQALKTAKEKEIQAKRSRGNRERVGDGFGGPASIESSSPGLWYGCFASLFQGDHLGVEFALNSHETLLCDHGLLKRESRLLGKAPFPIGSTFEGLIIDDYFCISKQRKLQEPLTTVAAVALAEARNIYERAGLLGSVEKDVESACVFKAAGAEVVSSREVLLTVGSQQ